MMRPFVIASAVLLTSCGSRALLPPEPEPLPAESSEAAPVAVRVTGVVTDRWGYVVPNAWITVRVGSPNEGASEAIDCRGASHLPTRTRSSPTGGFDVVVEAGRRPPFRACLEIEALPPAGLRLRENTVVLPSALFTAASEVDGAARAVGVHIVLY